jgi:integrase
VANGLPIPRGRSTGPDGGFPLEQGARRGCGQAVLLSGYEAQHGAPRVITLDGNAASHRAVAKLQERGTLPQRVCIRCVVVSDLIKAKQADGASKRYIKDLQNRLERFVETFGHHQIASVTAEEIDAWLRTLAVAPLTRNTYRLRIGTLFEYARTRRLCGENPVSSVAKAKELKSKVGILTPEQLARLFESASDETLPYWALGAFAGLRSAELERLEWADVHFDSGLVEVTASKAKTAQRRFVPMADALKEWLGPYQGRQGKVAPIGLRKKLEADRERACLESWPPNALRHSFASYHLAQFQDAARLSLEMGHRDQRLVFAHYRELVKPAQAAKYWKIAPIESTALSAVA